MHKMISLTLLLSMLVVPAASAQVSMSNGSQSGTVNSPAIAQPRVQGPTPLSSPSATPQTMVTPQMPTTANPAGASPGFASPQPGASPGVPVLNSPTNQSKPSP